MSVLKAVTIGCDEAARERIAAVLAERCVHVESGFPGAGAAIEGLKPAQAESCLFLVRIGSRHDLPHLGRLGDTFLGRPVVALIEGDDPMLFLEANRAGAAQVVPLPFDADDLGAALDRISLQFAAQGRKATVIAVSGVSGGCGATTIAINLAHEVAALRGVHCILTEFSLQVGSLAAYLDLAPQFTTQDILGDVRRADSYLVKQVLTKVADNFEVLAGPYRAIAPVEVRPGDLARVLQLAQQLTDVLVVDLPCTYDDRFFEALAAADRIVLVAEQKVPSLHALRIVRAAMARSDGLTSPLVVLNRFSPGTEGFSLDGLRKQLDAPGLRPIANDYAAVSAAVNHGRPLRKQAPKSRALADIVALMRDLFPDDAPAPSSRKPARRVGRPLLARFARSLGL